MQLRYEKMTRQQLIQELEERGMVYDELSSNKTLIELLYQDDEENLLVNEHGDSHTKRGHFDDEY